MSARRWIARLASRPARRVLLGSLFAIVLPLATQAQEPQPAPPMAVAPAAALPAGMPADPAPAPAPTIPGASSAPTYVPANSPAEPAIAMPPPDVQVVHFELPAGVRLEVLTPGPEPLAGVENPADTYGLKTGVGYRLRLTNIPNHPEAALYPVLEVTGHLHRPHDVAPGRFPIRVVIQDIDLEETIERGRLVTYVVYLEEPDQALPINLPAHEIPIATLSAIEDPLRVGAALGRVMAIMRLGGRVPTVDEWANVNSMGTGSTACPFAGPEGVRCPMPAGLGRGAAAAQFRPWLPRDEYLCDGGDRADVAHFGANGELEGIDPRDAVVRFQAGYRPRLLPTNMVCIYAPRFAAVRTSLGTNEAFAVEIPRGTEMLESQVTYEQRQNPKRLVQNESAQAHRHRQRASSIQSRILPFNFTEVRVLQGYTSVEHMAGFVRVQNGGMLLQREKAAGMRGVTRPIVLKTAETAVVTGIIESANQMIMAWKPQEIAGVELPPDKPGLAVVKRVSQGVAEPGDVVTFSIQYRNMGNTPISSVSIVDSLMPRLEYVRGSALGPAGTVFTAAENRANSTELRWDLPAALAPGSEGYVSFQAKVR